jgi:hypothetical protein
MEEQRRHARRYRQLAAAHAARALRAPMGENGP